MPRINFCDQTDEARSLNVNASKTVNMFVDFDITNKRPILYGSPGLLRIATASGFPCRGLKVVSKDETIMYALFGPDFYRIYLNGSLEKIGSIASTQGIVYMPDNGLQVLIVDGSAIGYIYTIATNALTEIDTATYPGGVTATFLDGFFISNDPNSNQMRSSNPYEGLIWDALDVAKAEGDPDNLLVVLSDYHQLLAFGRIATEIWYDNANLNFPLSRVEGAVIPYGVGAIHSVVSIGGSILLLARTTKGERVIVRTTGTQPTQVSTPAIDSILGTMRNVEDAEAFGYMQDGHPFYEITFPSADRTFVYDLKTDKWHERTTIDSDGISHRHAARGYAFFGGQHIVGDYRNGNLYQLRMDVYSDNSAKVQRIRRLMISGEVTAFIDVLSIDMETGIGATSEQGDDPKVSLRVSRDGGHTWGNEKTVSLGPLGNYRQRVQFHQLGRSRKGLVVEMLISDPIKIAITGASVNEF
jgi:hypothetical protein